jgi:hypothetical protein
MSLHLYAVRYATDGFASFVFDYRTFGGSSGEPRLWVSPKRHLQDWDEALTYLRVSEGLPLRTILHGNCDVSPEGMSKLCITSQSSLVYLFNSRIDKLW